MSILDPTVDIFGSKHIVAHLHTSAHEHPLPVYLPAAARADLCVDLGWEPVDTGKLDQALHLEHMTLLWVKMVRVQGQSSGLVWGALRR